MKFKIINKQSLCIPEDPVFVLDTTCVLKNLKVVEKFFRSKKKVQISKKNFLNYFLRFFGVFVPVPEAEKWYFSD
jgi:hypothetical protein